jgi:hypothetical protein
MRTMMQGPLSRKSSCIVAVFYFFFDSLNFFLSVEIAEAGTKSPITEKNSNRFSSVETLLHVLPHRMPVTIQ